MGGREKILRLDASTVMLAPILRNIPTFRATGARLQSVVIASHLVGGLILWYRNGPDTEVRP
jgi:hypothetical protein